MMIKGLMNSFFCGVSICFPFFFSPAERFHQLCDCNDNDSNINNETDKIESGNNNDNTDSYRYL